MAHPSAGAGRPLRIANVSGFYGDRLSAAREMLDGGPVDVLTGDWLAELTMSVLARQRARDPDAGYATTFVDQLEDVLGDCLDRGVRIVSNAGGLNPHGCAAAVRRIGARLGREVRVAVIDGDDATEALAHARAAGWAAPHLDTGEPLPSGAVPEAVNAYLGCRGIVEALAAGADVVITGRVTDAAVVLGPAAWHHGWARDDWDALAGAVAAGHVIECGAQATGGNFAFFTELAGMERVGFPLAEVHADGSAVITKHPGTGGAVTVETITAQLLYEVGGPRYLTPDVVVRLDTVRLEPAGPDRVLLSGTRGEPAPGQVKVGAIVPAGWRTGTTFVLTGGEIEAKAAAAQAALWAGVPGGREGFDDVAVRLVRADRPDPASMTDAVALLTVAVRGQDRDRVGRFARTAVETWLTGYPGLYFTGPPVSPSACSVFWPVLMPAADFPQRVTFDGRTWEVPAVRTPAGAEPERAQPAAAATPSGPAAPDGNGGAHAGDRSGETTRVPLGTLVGARSGDKGGNATLGVWARTDATHAWLRRFWTEDRLRALLPEAAGLELRLWELPHLRAVGATIVGLLGKGVGVSLALDSQGKGLAEYLRAKHVDVPVELVPNGAGHGR
ncbi:acyclic terpene utilization AtuA family protein [Georgenia thermotolerans]|uniref:Acyclic terpene utilization AtuA family protein n=1 Tax=Georgenia thermotolerans TaxID=527326 RepID=A0A7J5UTG4_9MICO|nr:acyclic terpene utilization AtuA family protein [Georgenia thermotolerans]KAE8765571.1 acyclic terpene utilization AtuA family protein [Georgenia thermotolerans]